VDAQGQQTNVSSLTDLTDQSGVQTANNYQTSASKGTGSSQASASNVGILKRRRRSGIMSSQRQQQHEFRTSILESLSSF
jgi:hypothetical protein